MSHSRRLLVALASILVLAGCTPHDVSDWFARNGLSVTTEQATAIATNLSTDYTRNYSDAEIQQMIVDRWAGTGDEDRAIAVARCESGLDEFNKNKRSTASGLFQLLKMHWAGKFNPFNPRANIEKAFALWKSSGWKPWAASRGCWS